MNFNINTCNSLDIPDGDVRRNVLTITDANGNIIWKKSYIIIFRDPPDVSSRIWHIRQKPLDPSTDSEWQLVKHGEDAILPIFDMPVPPEGMAFAGWSQSTTNITALPENNSIYAVYVSDTHVMTVNPNGGTLGNEVTEYTIVVGNNMPTIPTPTRPQCVFIGWSLRKQLYPGELMEVDEFIDFNKKCNIIADVTAYAAWKYVEDTI